MAGVVKKKLASGKHRAWFYDWQGRQRFFPGTSNAKETLKMAERLEDHHVRIKMGDLPPPKASDKPRPFEEVRDEYLSWGKSVGGRGGRPWAAHHIRKRTKLLTWWMKELNLQLLSDLIGIQTRVEVAGVLRHDAEDTPAGDDGGRS